MKLPTDVTPDASSPRPGAVMRSDRGLQAGPPAVVPFLLPRPEPVFVSVVHFPCGGTAIARTWASPRDAAACRLCPAWACSAHGRDHCLVGSREHVPFEEAATYSLVDRGTAPGTRPGPGRLDGDASPAGVERRGG